ncbi:Peroxidase [Rhynchospora pubera]|uniref:Peroxidase n=1 Tax=Rhynchospora pubera TaxID=906938 RepID=A0AAV8GE04_9POAL|nr:Peroxidase [Rhynchospora pubera]
MARPMGLLSLTLLLFSVFTIAIADDTPAYLLPVDGLDPDYYKKSCPDMEAIIQRMVKKLLKDDYTYGASLIRLHFHDCAVNGCDGSILLDIPNTSEKYAAVSATLRGYDFIEDVKASIEAKCPRTVSCSDILTAVARDAAHVIGAPYWSLNYGRKDGRISFLEQANALPMGRESITDLIMYFQSMGLSPVDLVSLQGAHTIGRSSCKSFAQRLYNFQGTNNADPTLNDQYLNYLQRKCSKDSEYTELDATTPTIFDNAYYKNLQNNMGLLETDQKMWVDSRTGPIVKALANQQNLFYAQFGAAMVKLSLSNVLTNDEGEVRIKCSAVL